MSTVVPEKTIPSHQGPVTQTLIPDLDVATDAILTRPTTRRKYWPPFVLLRASRFSVPESIVALNSTLVRWPTCRLRGDMWEDDQSPIAKTDRAPELAREFVA